MAGRRRIYRDRRVAAAMGWVFLIAAAISFREAYEWRRHPRPLAVSWIGV
jgi:hypothetical protein